MRPIQMDSVQFKQFLEGQDGVCGISEEDLRAYAFDFLPIKRVRQDPVYLFCLTDGFVSVHAYAGTTRLRVETLRTIQHGLVQELWLKRQE